LTLDEPSAAMRVDPDAGEIVEIDAAASGRNVTDASMSKKLVPPASGHSTCALTDLSPPTSDVIAANSLPTVSLWPDGGVKASRTSGSTKLTLMPLIGLPSASLTTTVSVAWLRPSASRPAGASILKLDLSCDGTALNVTL